jgi:hypothetical protein
MQPDCLPWVSLHTNMYIFYLRILFFWLLSKSYIPTCLSTAFTKTSQACNLWKGNFCSCFVRVCWKPVHLNTTCPYFVYFFVQIIPCKFFWKRIPREFLYFRGLIFVTRNKKQFRRHLLRSQFQCFFIIFSEGPCNCHFSENASLRSHCWHVCTYVHSQHLGRILQTLTRQDAILRSRVTKPAP